MIHEKKTVPVKVLYKHPWANRMVKHEAQDLQHAPADKYVHGETYTLHCVGGKRECLSLK